MSYHHGDLRRALLAAARQVLAERGPAGVTLREVARRAGVSHAAPYHHFADKAVLMAALAEDSFQRLGAALHTARDGVPAADPLARLQAIGVAYVSFAAASPAAFRLMWRRDLRGHREGAPGAADGGATAVEHAEQAVYRVLVEAIAACQAAGMVVGGAPEPLARTAWCLVHGLATLLLDGPLAGAATAPGQVEHLAREVTTTFARGLLVR